MTAKQHLMNLTHMKKIIVTGANGFVGSSLAKYLISLGYEVTPLVRYSSSLDLLSDVKAYKIDYSDDKQLAEIMNNHEIIIHCAALTRAKKWDPFRKINISLTDRLVQFSNQSSTMKQFIFLSSQAASGCCKSMEGRSEEDICQPITMYGKSKLVAEHSITTNSEKRWTIVRPVSVYGPGDKDFLLFFKMIERGIAPLIGSKKRYIQLIYIDDLVRLIEKCIANKKAYDQVIFATHPAILSYDQFIEALKEAIGKKVRIIKVPEFIVKVAAIGSEILSVFSDKPNVLNREKTREMLQEFWIVKSEKMSSSLDFTPDTDIVQTLSHTYEWYKKVGWL